ncbi:LuxR family transcriptional regulator [Streptacidiphilus pinicola]|uniref:LuxR family transcriptional regulator n=1 Tax=Streptacidiphilus pinicola TaxID=2219663 RepID=A0A2X0IWQ5_9ACTN|nr:LuxR family transcriptional regulator [Streptacidiphilus pinicola]RAG82176.1 LuxR family transcriptional regulator [Streptacidiphilus pinicola]
MDSNAPRDLVGRAEQIEEISGFFGAGTVQGRALLLSGDPGVGKTVLLQEIAKAMAAAGSTVLSATGVQFEAELTYAGLHELLFPLGDQFQNLGDTHREALRSALGFGHGPVPDRLLVANAVHTLLRQVALEHPVFVVVDDLPWLDRASAAVLGFVARRLAGSRIGLLAASRSGADSFFERGQVTEYELQPLDRDAALDLINARYPGLAPRVRDRVLVQAQGNPLALLELPTALTPAQRTALADVPAVLPLSQRLQALYASRISALPTASQHLLLLLALDGSGELGVLRIATEGPADLSALAVAESDRLVTVDDRKRRVVFRHPLIASAVVATSTLNDRCRTHLALADFRKEEPERRAWHLGEATLTADEEVAALLQQAAHLIARRGDAVSAIATMTRAAELSPRSADRGRRLAEAAYIGADATGELDVASVLLDSARRAEPRLTNSLLAAATAAFLVLNSGDGDVDTAHRLLVGAVESGTHAYDAHDSALIEALHTLLLVCWFGGRSALWEPFYAALDRLRPTPPTLLSACSKTFPDPARTGAAGLKELDQVLAGARDEEDLGRIIRMGTASVYPDRLAEVREASWRVVRQGRRGGPARRHIGALMHLGLQDFLTGEWEEAGRLAGEGLRVCEEHEYRFFTWYFQYIQALLAAVGGDHQASHALADRITQWAVPRKAFGAVAFANHARVLADLGEGNYEGAYRHAAAMSPPGVLASHTPHAMWVCMDLVEAAIRTQRFAEAQAHVRAMDEAGIASLSPRLELLVAASTALVSPDDQVIGRFECALVVSGAEQWPFELARARLVYGERLRRMRSLTDARTQLTSAAETFERLGARPWATRANNELRATRRTRTSGTRDSVTLTAQELEIAQLAASGLTNKQIAERLYLSPRTVGSHLYQLFPKLGITSRAALRDALASFPSPSAP